MTDCYVCNEPIVDGDRVVPLPVRTFRPQDEGGYLLAGGEDRVIHAHHLTDR